MATDKPARRSYSDVISKAIGSMVASVVGALARLMVWEVAIWLATGVSPWQQMAALRALILTLAKSGT